MTLRILLAATLCVALAAPARAALVISKNATSNVTCTGGVCTATAANAVLNVKDLKKLLQKADIKIVSGSTAQDIEIDINFEWAKSFRLTLDAYRSITFTQAVTAEGRGAVSLITNDGGTGGDYNFINKGHLAFWDTTSDLIINGTTFTLVNDIKTLASSIAANPKGFYALALGYDASVDGTYRASPISTWFYGTFEGLGHAISNLTIRDTRKKREVAFMGYLFGTVRDVTLTNVNVRGGDFRDDIAGLVATNFGTIISSHVSGSISSDGTGTSVGGLISYSDGAVIRCSSSAAVRGGELSGGLVGMNDNGTILQSYSSGSVVGNYYIGGLVGTFEDASSIAQSYSTASVHGSQYTEFMGGLFGTYGYDFGGASASQVFSTGLLSSTRGLVGGLIGSDVQTSNGISSAYWNLDTSGISDPSRGAGNIANDPGIAGLTDAQLKSGLPAGFDPAVWAQSPSINNGYPYLIANPPPN